MIKLIAKINPRAGKEQLVFDKLKEVFNNPIITKIEQLSDFYVVLNFKEENVETMSSIQDFDGILDINLIPANVIVTNAIDIEENENHFIIFVKTESGKREQAMKKLLSLDAFKIYNAAYFFDDRADVLLEIITANSPNDFISSIRSTEGVIDTTFYNLPHIKSTKATKK